VRETTRDRKLKRGRKADDLNTTREMLIGKRLEIQIHQQDIEKPRTRGRRMWGSFSEYTETIPQPGGG